MRNYNETFESLKKNLLDMHDVDIYIHTYETLGFTLNANRKSSAVGEYLKDSFDRTSPKLNIDHMNALYMPKISIVEEYDLIQPLLKNEISFINPNRFRGPSENPLNPLSQFRKIYLSFLDIENSNIEYDYIVRYRPDLYLKQPLELHKLHCTQSHSLILAKEMGECFGVGILSDIFAFGRFSVMKIYMEMYKYIKQLYLDTQDEWERTKSKHLEWNPHIFLKLYLDSRQVNYKSRICGVHK